jgi:hypothetical protein
MKSRHTAVLLVVGWYLMVPPLSGPAGVATQAPFTLWTRTGTSFSSEQECEQAKQAMIPGPGNARNLDDQHLLAIQDAKCVSSESLPPASESGQSPTQ